MPWKEIDLIVPVEVLGQFLITIVALEVIRPIEAVRLTGVPIKVLPQGLLLIEVPGAHLQDRPAEPTEVLAQHVHQVELTEAILVVLHQDRPVVT